MKIELNPNNNLFVSRQEDDVCSLCGLTGSVKYAGVKDVLFHVPGTWSLYCCNHCGLVWLNPKPLPEQIAAFYENYHTHDDYDETALTERIFSRGIPAVTLGYRSSVSSNIEIFLGFIFSLFGPFREEGEGSIFWLHARERGKLLDVGCGSGAYLRRFGRIGWDTWGIEFDPVAAARAAKGMDQERVFTGRIEDCSFKNDFFDVITMIHVVEHLQDPLSVLKKCMDLLKPGGKLVISTPNASSWGARFFKEYWRGWEPPRHLYIYSVQSLTNLVKMAGFKIEKVFTPTYSTALIWNDSLHIRSLRLGKKPGMLRKVVNYLMKLTVWLSEYIAVRCGSSAGELLHCVAKKTIRR